MELTGDTSDKDRFKVPGLRNAQMTYPYFHNGSVSSLDSSVWIMARTELNMELTRSQTDEIVAFLKTLTGDIRLEAKRDPFGVR
jgi:cytochrome c peroxidase